jgi:hypothetical protein
METQGRLSLRFMDDGDGTGELMAQASSNGFCGEGSARFSTERLLEFAEAITAFPIPKDNPPHIAGGFFEKDGSGELAQEHLALKVYPVNRRGHLGVQVRIATALWNGHRPESRHAVKLEIITNYEPMVQFSRDLKALVEGQSREVILEGDILP